MPKERIEWDASTDLRFGLDLKDTNNMIDQLVEESDGMIWEVLWAKYAVSTVSEPQIGIR